MNTKEKDSIPDAPEVTLEPIEAGAQYAAIDGLAQDLQFTLERYDPTDGSEWSDLTEHEREVYRATVRQLLSRTDLLPEALGPAAAGLVRTMPASGVPAGGAEAAG